MILIDDNGLIEGIRCALCTNPMANDKGCDGGCVVNEYQLKKVLDVIKALEQEPMLDKIRAEIEQTPTVIWEENKKAYIFASYFKKQVLQIIDKYRKEN